MFGNLFGNNKKKTEETAPMQESAQGYGNPQLIHNETIEEDNSQSFVDNVQDKLEDAKDTLVDAGESIKENIEETVGDSHEEDTHEEDTESTEEAVGDSREEDAANIDASEDAENTEDEFSLGDSLGSAEDGDFFDNEVEGNNQDNSDEEFLDSLDSNIEFDDETSKEENPEQSVDTVEEVDTVEGEAAPAGEILEDDEVYPNTDEVNPEATDGQEESLDDILGGDDFDEEEKELTVDEYFDGDNEEAVDTEVTPVDAEGTPEIVDGIAEENEDFSEEDTSHEEGDLGALLDDSADFTEGSDIENEDEVNENAAVSQSVFFAPVVDNTNEDDIVEEEDVSDSAKSIEKTTEIVLLDREEEGFHEAIRDEHIADSPVYLVNFPGEFNGNEDIPLDADQRFTHISDEDKEDFNFSKFLDIVHEELKDEEKTPVIVIAGLEGICNTIADEFEQGSVGEQVAIDMGADALRKSNEYGINLIATISGEQKNVERFIAIVNDTVDADDKNENA